jgi:hypothetical protein
LVPESKYDKAAKIAVEVAKGFTVGDPFGGTAKLGPLAEDVARHGSAHVAEADESDVGHGDSVGKGFGTREFRGNSARLQTGKLLEYKGTDSVPVFILTCRIGVLSLTRYP